MALRNRGRQPAKYLNVNKKKDGATWRLRWGRAPAQINLTLGTISDADAEERRRDIQAALDSGRWPAWALKNPKVREYARGNVEAVKARDLGDVLADYQNHLAASGGGQAWRVTCLANLKELQAFAQEHGEERLQDLTPATAQEFILSIPGSVPPFLAGRKRPRSAATANRALAACRKFFRWGVTFRGMPRNPFVDVEGLPEEDVERIVYLTADERDRVLAEATEEPDGLAIWLALYAGLRRKEVALLEWERVSLMPKVRKITIRNTKTPSKKKRKARREVDIASPLFRKLKSVMPARRVGRVVPWPENEAEWTYRAVDLIRRIRDRLAKKKGAKKWVDKVGWNNFRHTFCTLHLQAGVNPNKIIGWTGHSIDVFMTHYGEHAPDFDDDIDAVERERATGKQKKRRA